MGIAVRWSAHLRNLRIKTLCDAFLGGRLWGRKWTWLNSSQRFPKTEEGKVHEETKQHDSQKSFVFFRCISWTKEERQKAAETIEPG